MVMVQTQPQVETRPITLTELGEHLGIPITVRPWWGSARQRNRRTHRRCGSILTTMTIPAIAQTSGSSEPYCPQCHRTVGANEIEVGLRPPLWLCPGGYGNPVKRPEVQSGVVVLWQGPCRVKWGNRTHRHSQSIEVLDVGDSGMLVCVTVAYGSHSLIGMDDGHPFVTGVTRRSTTVKEAFDWLVPKKVKEAQVLGLDVKRQGDWFFIPYDRPVRETRARQVRAQIWRGTLRYGLEPKVVYADGPLFQAYSPPTRHIGARVIYRNYPAYLLVKGVVTAPDHPPLHLGSWHQAVRTRGLPNRDGNQVDE